MLHVVATTSYRSTCGQQSSAQTGSEQKKVVASIDRDDDEQMTTINYRRNIRPK